MRIILAVQTLGVQTNIHLHTCPIIFIIHTCIKMDECLFFYHVHMNNKNEQKCIEMNV